MRNKMLSLREVVARVGVHRVTLWRQIHAGTFPKPLKRAGRLWWHEAEIATWLKASR